MPRTITTRLFQKLKMRFGKKLILNILFAFVILAGFWIFPDEASATYDTGGFFISTNLLPSGGASMLNSFTYTVSSLPAGTSMKIQFSKDGTGRQLNWYNSSGSIDSWNTLSSGTNTINLSGLGWYTHYFYYKVLFTSDTTATAVLDDISLAYFTLADTYDTYGTSGTLVSTNLLSVSATSIDSFAYTASSIPPNTSLAAQFSTNNSTWYNSSGVLDGSNALSAGANTISLSGLSWSGSAFYYKVLFTSDGTYTPVLEEITLAYNYNANVAPNAPTLVSPASASYTNDATPTLSANYSDNDAGDVGTTNYRISSSSLSNCVNNTNIVASGTSSQTPDNNENTTYTPGSSIGSDATYYWCSQNNDGDLTSDWTQMGSFTLDTAVPTTTDNFSNNDTWTSANQTITLTPADATSGVSWTKYCADTTNTCSPASGTSYTSAVTISTEDTSYFRYASQDNAGNTQTTVSKTVKIDTTAPLTAISATRNGNTINATLACLDASGSGCSVTYYCVDSEGTCTPTTIYTTPASFTISTNTWVRYYSIDSVLNSGTTATSDALQPGGGGAASTPDVAPTAVEEAKPTPILEQIVQVPQQIAEQLIEIPQQIIEQVSQIGQQISEIVKVLTPQKEEEITYPPIAESVPKETPDALQGLKIMSVNPLGKFKLSPTGSGIGFFADKLPQLKKTLGNLGINVNNLDSVKKLSQAELYLPGLTQTVLTQAEILQANKLANASQPPSPAVSSEAQKELVKSEGLQANAIASVQGVPLAQLSAQALSKMPSDIVFARTAGGLIDFSSALIVDKQGNTKQKITTIVGKPMELVIKPDNPASRVTGLLTLKSQQNAEGPKTNQNIFAKLFSAALSVANPAPSTQISAPNGLLMQKFEYTEAKPGIFKAEINAPTAEGEYEIVTVVEYKDQSLTPTETRLTAVVDPEGYVYRQALDGKLRITNATVSIYWLNSDTKKYELWQAEKFLQKNPVLTDDTGKYFFLVPQGTYYLTATAADYSDFKGAPFNVKEDNGVKMDIELKKITFLPEWFHWNAVITVLLFTIMISIFILILKKGRKY